MFGTYHLGSTNVPFSNFRASHPSNRTACDNLTVPEIPSFDDWSQSLLEWPFKNVAFFSFSLHFMTRKREWGSNFICQPVVTQTTFVHIREKNAHRLLNKFLFQVPAVFLAHQVFVWHSEDICLPSQPHGKRYLDDDGKGNDFLKQRHNLENPGYHYNCLIGMKLWALSSGLQVTVLLTKHSYTTWLELEKRGDGESRVSSPRGWRLEGQIWRFWTK